MSTTFHYDWEANAFWKDLTNQSHRLHLCCRVWSNILGLGKRTYPPAPSLKGGEQEKLQNVVYVSLTGHKRHFFTPLASFPSGKGEAESLFARVPSRLRWDRSSSRPKTLLPTLCCK